MQVSIYSREAIEQLLQKVTLFKVALLIMLFL